jgi:hypothetical protein
VRSEKPPNRVEAVPKNPASDPFITGYQKFLHDFAVRRLGRDVDPTDPEVTELAEALERQVFKLGGRTNPRGYFWRNLFCFQQGSRYLG